MTQFVCVSHGPTCANARHTFVALEDYERGRNRQRLRRVAIGNHFLESVLNGSFQPGKMSSDLPADAEVVSVRADPARDCLVAWIRSDTFEVVEESHEVPEMFITFTITTPDITLE